MKPYIILLVVVACGCSKRQQAADVAISCIVDITDPLTVSLNPKELNKEMGLETDVYRAVTLHVTSITDLKIRPVTEIVLPRYIPSLDDQDPQKRNKDIRRFYSKSSALLSAIQDTASSRMARAHSECYASICRELEFLASQQGAKRVLIVVSDLQENGDVSFYGKGGISIRHVQEKLASLRDLPNLSGIAVHFVYQPRDRDDERRYLIVFEAYRKLFQQKGAAVHQQPTFTFK